MSETKTTTEKIYVGSGKRVKDFDMVNITINLTKLSQEGKEFFFEYDGNKYAKLNVVGKKETDDYGKTHYVAVDTFKPEAKDEKGSNDLPF
jgi:hypothetical protein